MKVFAKNGRSSGFTLVEILVVVSLLSILIGAVVTIINPAAQFAKARDATRKNDLEHIQNLLELYYNDHGYYPIPHNTVKTDCATKANHNCYVYSGTNTSSSPWISALVPKYTPSLPVDPINSASSLANAPSLTTGYGYGYVYGNVDNVDLTIGGQHYDLYTLLEGPSDPLRCSLKKYTFGYGLTGMGGPFNCYCPSGGTYCNPGTYWISK